MMYDNEAINNLTSAYNGSYWQGINTEINGISSKLIYTGDSIGAIQSNCDYGITLNENAIKEIVEEITKQKEISKITPDNGPEIPRWTGFLSI